MEILEVLRRPNKWEFSSRSSFVSYSKSSAMTNLFNPKPWSHIIGAKNIDFDSFKPSEEPR